MSIMRDLANGKSADEVVNREALKYAVQSTIFCPLTNVVLDVRNAVLITGTNADGVSDTKVISGVAWDSREDAFRILASSKGITLEVIDGRVK